MLLVKRYPELLKHMLSLAMKEDLPEEKVRGKAFLARQFEPFPSLWAVQLQ